jgi:hypothetical protein
MKPRRGRFVQLRASRRVVLARVMAYPLPASPGYYDASDRHLMVRTYDRRARRWRRSRIYSLGQVIRVYRKKEYPLFVRRNRAGRPAVC